ncbi:MAG: SPOR domain-containing protein [Alphaproteobacteria bacterium]|nr:SPOR domain-containing protein [Alphaproteobacteria bacterium]MBV9373318.1 SPOR domain-containing protein [Alphaproteobacteria bacterium]MBV9900317.1 SPOR domain-containing protein [Alphaproteobacteria bacterium]
MTQVKWGTRLGLAALGAGMLLAGGPASAQPNGTSPPETSGSALSRNLRTLADSPRSLPALMGAGQAALELGDPRAALTFFARAEEVAPRDGRIKMWMGSALVQLEQPRAALKFFKDATDLGVAEADVARDRGLAYDISGDPRRAQRDYRLALQNRRDDEVTRRLALSLAITGDRQAALQLLDGQLVSGDRAAGRTRALVLALTGDMAGAGRAVQASLPGPQGSAMLPFLARLTSLGYADRALAVHLGHFPTDGRTAPATRYASDDSLPGVATLGRGGSTEAATEAGRPDPAQQLLQRRVAEGEAARAAVPAPQRTVPTQVASSAPATGRAATRAPARSARGLAPPVSAWSWSRGVDPVAQPARAPARAAAAATPRKPQDAGRLAEPVRSHAAPPQPTVAVASEPAPPPREAPMRETPVEVAAADPTPLSGLPSSSLPPPAPDPAPVQAEPPAAPPTEAAPVPSASRLADLAAAVASIADPPAARPAPSPSRPSPSSSRPRTEKPAPGRAAADSKPGREKPAAERSAEASSRPRAAVTAAAAGKKAASPAPAREPSRVWVQVAGGADRASLPREFARLRDKAPKLLGARSAWTAKLNATNRLLVGPFADAEAAQSFVNAMRKADLSAFAWTSEAGEKVEKLAAK